ncbi:hypothetical protein WG66_008407, partial [Moniliophthora roreri]
SHTTVTRSTLILASRNPGVASKSPDVGALSGRARTSIKHSSRLLWKRLWRKGGQLMFLDQPQIAGDGEKLRTKGNTSVEVQNGIWGLTRSSATPIAEGGLSSCLSLVQLSLRESSSDQAVARHTDSTICHLTGNLPTGLHILHLKFCSACKKLKCSR